MKPSHDILGLSSFTLGIESAQSQSPEAFQASFDTSRVPTAPGCYIMRDARDQVVYVGKAKNLRARVRAYINDADSRFMVRFLMQRVAQVEFLVTNNEKEALLLENSLIKKHKPRYNVRLKDDKTYVSLRLDPREDFPRLTVVRRYRKDGARYFGPYSSAASVRGTLRQLQRIFPLRTCSDCVMNNRTRPCLYYQMNQCMAPCVGYVDRATYHDVVNQVVMLLEGRSADLEKTLVSQIEGHAQRLEFEKAALLRDRLFMLRHLLERQQTVKAGSSDDRDVFGLYEHGRYCEVQVLFFRGGKMTGGRSFSIKHREMPLDEVLGSFLVQYYSEAAIVPPEVLVPAPLEDADALAEVLTEQRGTKVSVACPQRGEKRTLVQLAQRNARSNFEEKQLREKANQDLVEEVRRLLKLSRLPRRIECFDISTMQGDKPVGSMVCFENGEPNKSRYRKYAVREVAGQDDFAMLREVLIRRLQRGVAEDDLPDFLLIDGGRGQLGVAAAVLRDLGLEDLDAAAIAKSRIQGEARSPERFFIRGRKNPVILPQNSKVVLFLARIRDEAHRFAITYHRKRRGKSTLATSLTGIPGVGPERAKTLLRKLGSVARIRMSSVDEIAALPGFSQSLAKTVYEHLHTEGGTQ